MAGACWRRRSSLVFFVLFLLVAGFGVFSWYQSLYMFRWSPEEEREYRLSKNKQVKFQREKFDAVLGALDERRWKHREESSVFRDLFFGE